MAASASWNSSTSITVVTSITSACGSSSGIGMPWPRKLDHPRQLGRPDAEHRAAPGLLLRDRHQLQRRQPRLGQRLAHHVDTAGDVDPHRADHAAASALGAAVVDELLPFLQVVQGDVAREQALDGRERRALARVHAPQQVELAGWRVLRVLRALVEVAGLGAVATVHAGLEVECQRGRSCAASPPWPGPHAPRRRAARAGPSLPGALWPAGTA